MIDYRINMTELDELSHAVGDAETFRVNDQHQKVVEAWRTWIGPAPFAKARQLIGEASQLAPEYHDLWRVGLAGIARIAHVSCNSQLNQSNPNWNDPIQLIFQIGSFYNVLNPTTLVPWTIHRGPIYWPAEIAQDMVRTYQRKGQLDLAAREISTAIVKTNQVIEDLAGVIDLRTPKGQLGYIPLVTRQTYLGAMSASGVLYARDGRQNKYQPNILIGLRRVYGSHTYEPNPHRLATLAMWTLSSSVSPNYASNSENRFIGTIEAMQCWVIAFRHNPNVTLLATKQFFAK
jgi:hypothetical protein